MTNQTQDPNGPTRPIQNGSEGSLNPLLVNVLLGIRDELGQVKAMTVGNRTAMLERTDMLKERLDTRIQDLKEEVFWRFQRGDASLAALEQRVREQESAMPSSMMHTAMFWAIEHLPWKHLLFMAPAFLIGALGQFMPEAILKVLMVLFGH